MKYKHNYPLHLPAAFIQTYQMLNGLFEFSNTVITASTQPEGLTASAAASLWKSEEVGMMTDAVVVDIFPQYINRICVSQTKIVFSSVSCRTSHRSTSWDARLQK